MNDTDARVHLVVSISSRHESVMSMSTPQPECTELAVE